MIRKIVSAALRPIPIFKLNKNTFSIIKVAPKFYFATKDPKGPNNNSSGAKIDEGFKQ